MNERLKIRQNIDTVLEVDQMYLCGGFREGQAAPEHMWIEDRTHSRSYDTFIQRGGIGVRYSAGIPDNPFQPACEASPFEADEIMRVKVAGYTMGQLMAIAAGAEKSDAVKRTCKATFGDGMDEHDALLAAKEAVKAVREKVVAADNKDEYPDEDREEVAELAIEKAEEEMGKRLSMKPV